MDGFTKFLLQCYCWLSLSSLSALSSIFRSRMCFTVFFFIRLQIEHKHKPGKLNSWNEMKKSRLVRGFVNNANQKKNQVKIMEALSGHLVVFNDWIISIHIRNEKKKTKKNLLQGNFCSFLTASLTMQATIYRFMLHTLFIYKFTFTWIPKSGLKCAFCFNFLLFSLYQLKSLTLNWISIRNNIELV